MFNMQKKLTLKQKLILLFMYFTVSSLSSVPAMAISSSIDGSRDWYSVLILSAWKISGLEVGSVFSSLYNSSSYSFSPGRSPVYSILMSLSGISPERRIIFLAMSSILTAAPILKMKISFPSPRKAASSTSWQASGMVMK